MAKIARVDATGEIEEEREFVDDTIPLDEAEELGVAFGCQDGRCGSCRVEIVEGRDNLSEFTQNEYDAGMTEEEPYRLFCQCKVKSGLVKIRI